ncbi:MAG: hypothetical protein RL264_1445 [Bacteroidota bacterium]|jgi:cell division protein ZapA
MEKIALKVTIAGRTYPINVLETERENVLKAAEDINRAVDMLGKNYAVKDLQDLLAMSSLQLLSRSVNTKKEVVPADYSSVENALEQLVHDLK